MTVKLSRRDKQIVDGQHGKAAEMAMRILVRMAEVQGATEMMDVSQAHIDGCGLLSDAGLEFAETLAAKGGKVSIPTTLNAGRLTILGSIAPPSGAGRTYPDTGFFSTGNCTSITAAVSR